MSGKPRSACAAESPAAGRLRPFLALLAESGEIRIITRERLKDSGAALAGCTAVALLGAREDDAATLGALGLEHLRSYSLRPSAAHPRWILPHGGAGRSAAREYVAFGLKSHLLRLWLRASLRGAPAPRMSNLLVAGRRPPALERELAERLQQPVMLAFSLGTPGAYNKITATVLDAASARVIAFAKAATLPYAREATLYEEEILRGLENCAALRPSIPCVIDAFELGGARVLVTSAGPGSGAARSFGAEHAAFLATLQQHTGRKMKFADSAMWRSMQSSFAAMEDRLDEAWHARLASALRLLERELGATILPMALAHGDFAPWNTRARADGGLYVFDWEFARPQCTPLYDRFHFDFVTRLLLSRRRWTAGTLAKYLAGFHDEAPVRLLFLAFLTELTMFYFAAMHRRGQEQVDAGEWLLPQAGALLDRWPQWGGAMRS